MNNTKKKLAKRLCSIAYRIATRDKDLEADGIQERRVNRVRDDRDDLKNPNRTRDIPKKYRDPDVHEDKDLKLE